MKRFIAMAALASCVLAAQAQAPKKDSPSCTERNPVFAKFPNSFTTTCDRSRYSRLEVFEAREISRIDGDYNVVPHEGEYWYYIDQIAPDAQKRYPSRLEVFRNFETALKQAGGTPLWYDGDRAMHYRIRRASGEYFGITGCSSGSKDQCEGVMHKLVRPAPMEQVVVLNGDQIRLSLAESGKVAFYGIYFDNDKSAVKPDSQPTLAEMAKYLKANAALRVYIVGHTDGQGALDYNQRLSRDRAAAVVAVLAAAPYSIPKDRMTADGVGPLSPVAANDSEAGRAKNRRVEMVLR
jgi:outer membrane protein OmpA-like peptidoglycan-associated protein